MTSERELIQFISQYLQNQSREDVIKGVGDDCAVIKKDEDNCLLITTDTLVEGVHFDMTWHPPRLLGRKCASVNLSDIAAMGGRPRTCLLSIGFSGLIPSWFGDFLKGFTSVLAENDTMLVGGDTVKSQNDLIISVTVFGEGAGKLICYRSGAKPGDLIWVTGPLGHAAAGLELCRDGHCNQDGISEKWQQLIDAHINPEPEIEYGKVLASSGFVHAMMDISDGLATDLAHLCQESGVGADVEQRLLPVAGILKNAAKELNRDALDWILKGGEDYHLLFTTAAAEEKKLLRLVSEKFGTIFCIGRITEGPGVFLCNGVERREITFQGYDHFSRGQNSI